MKKLKDSLQKPIVILSLAFVFHILGSPKWTMPLGPWVGAVLFLYYSRKVSYKHLFLVGSVFMFITTFIGAYEVVPAPLPIFVVIALINGFKQLIPYLLDKWIGAKSKGFSGTLIFPAVFVTVEFLDSFGGGGTWGSISHTQYSWLPLVQIASVFGIWGISFLIYWFASLINWAMDCKFRWPIIRLGFLTSISLYLAVLVFGIIRTLSGTHYNEPKVRVATITMDNTNIIERCYQDTFGKKINLEPELSQTSQEIVEASSALPHFISDPYRDKYTKTREIMEENIDELFRRSQEEADQGAKIISWSEALGLILNDDENRIIKRAEDFSKENDVYMIMGLGVINPGPMDGQHLYMLNKTITTSPQGVVINSYLKSNPVAFAEPEYGSDDIIPVISTVYGDISSVICYDADFNHFMKQTGDKNTDLLFVPSGDWMAIAPYHSFMAVMRGIENGCSVIRPANRGTSIVSNPYGVVIEQRYFFDEDGEVLSALVPIKGINTIYNQIGDVLAYTCMVIAIWSLANTLYQRLKPRLSSIKEIRKVV